MRRRFRKLIEALLIKCQCPKCAATSRLAPEHVVTTTCKPGATTLRMVDESGTLRAVLVLSHLRFDRLGGTSAEFVDLAHFMEVRTYRRG